MSQRKLALLILTLACLAQPRPSFGQDSTTQPSIQPSDVILREAKKPDFNENIYYKDKLEFSAETGWLPINIPFAFDFLLGSGYNMTEYTLLPTPCCIPTCRAKREWKLYLTALPIMSVKVKSYGPMFGIDVRLGEPRRQSPE
jgi:hypothetical protein